MGTRTRTLSLDLRTRQALAACKEVAGDEPLQRWLRRQIAEAAGFQPVDRPVKKRAGGAPRMGLVWDDREIEAIERAAARDGMGRGPWMRAVVLRAAGYVDPQGIVCGLCGKGGHTRRRCPQRPRRDSRRTCAHKHCSRPAEEGYTRCRYHRDLNAAYRERRRAEGVCTQCSEPAAHGHTLCAAHLEAQRKAYARSVSLRRCPRCHEPTDGTTLCAECARQMCERRRK